MCTCRWPAPRLYARGLRGCGFNVYDVDGEVAKLTYNHINVVVPLKYLIKVKDDAKEPKFKVGQFAMFKGRRVEIIGYSEHYPQMYRVFVLAENYHTDAKESDLEKEFKEL